MLEFAKKYEEQLKQIYYNTVFDDSLKWEWLGEGREWGEPKDNTYEYHNFVSTHKGKILGKMGYHKDTVVRKADGFYCCHFTDDNGFIFMKDLLTCLKEIFDKFGMNKLSYCVVIGNPIESKWDKLTKKFGGRVIGIKEQDVVLQDGKLYDIKEYEILARDYFNKTIIPNL
jgi:hypothetical protein